MPIEILAILAVMTSGQSLLRVPVEPTTKSEQGSVASNPLAITRFIDYPARALEQGVSGGATIRCKVGMDASLTDCTIVTETPPGVGFGRAALRAAPLQPIPADSPLIGRDVYFSVNFSVQ